MTPIVQRSLGILVKSVQAFAREAPPGMSDAEKVAWIRSTYGSDLEPWEHSTRHLVEELANLAWDAIRHSPCAEVERELNFSDNLTSILSRAAVKSIVERTSRGPAGQVDSVPESRDA